MTKFFRSLVLEQPDKRFTAAQDGAPPTNQKARGKGGSVLGRCIRFGTKFGPKRHRDGHASVSPFSYSGTVMQGAFVVRLGPETKPKQGLFEGWVEEVDSCDELRFRSTEELLRFLGERYQAILKSEPVRPSGRTRHSRDGEEP